MFRRISAQAGQTMIEYILLLSVILGIAYGAFKKIEDYMVNNPDSFVSGYLGDFGTIFNAEGRYKRFRIPR